MVLELSVVVKLRENTLESLLIWMLTLLGIHMLCISLLYNHTHTAVSSL